MYPSRSENPCFFGPCSLLLTVLWQLLQSSTSSRATVSTELYDQFRSVHRNGQEEDASLYAERLDLFHARFAEVEAHNAQIKKAFTMAVNRFTDFKETELKAMLGYKRVGGRWAQSSASGRSSFLQVGDADHERPSRIDIGTLAKTVDWRAHMNVSNFVHDQGSCGSCWAHAAAAAIEAHHEILTGSPTRLATQEMIDCTANPRNCGGSGGCHGSTAEEGFELARNRGISLLADYDGVQGACPRTSSPSAIKIAGFVRLPENRASYLMHSMGTRGPVAMSVDAGSLFGYEGGVFDKCVPDTIVNHAVLGVGYGHDPESGHLYWLVKNSWGEKWGEKGYFRIQRFNGDSDYCGTDTKPEDGVYCADHPPTVRVCGMCGIHSDSAYPIIVSKRAARVPQEVVVQQHGSLVAAH